MRRTARWIVAGVACAVVLAACTQPTDEADGTAAPDGHTVQIPPTEDRNDVEERDTPAPADPEWARSSTVMAIPWTGRVTGNVLWVLDEQPMLIALDATTLEELQRFDGSRYNNQRSPFVQDSDPDAIPLIVSRLDDNYELMGGIQKLDADGPQDLASLGSVRPMGGAVAVHDEQDLIVLAPLFNDGGPSLGIFDAQSGRHRGDLAVNAVEVVPPDTSEVTDGLWVVTNLPDPEEDPDEDADALERVTLDGELLARLPFDGFVSHVEPDGAGGVYAATRNEVLHISPTGTVLADRGRYGHVSGLQLCGSLLVVTDAEPARVDLLDREGLTPIDEVPSTLDEAVLSSPRLLDCDVDNMWIASIDEGYVTRIPFSSVR